MLLGKIFDGEKISRTEIQKITEKPHKTPFCVCLIVLRMCFSLNLFPVLFDLFFCELKSLFFKGILLVVLEHMCIT